MFYKYLYFWILEFFLQTSEKYGVIQVGQKVFVQMKKKKKTIL